MNTIKHIPIILTGMYFALGLGSSALAELKLPNGGDRRPNLSADPFERAREAVRKLPATSPKSAPARAPVAEDPPPEPKKATRRAPEPAQKPTHQEEEAAAVAPAPTDAEGGDEEEAFTQSFTLAIDGFTKTAGGVRAAEEDDPETDVDETIPPASTAMLGWFDYVAQVNTSAAGLWENGTFVGHIAAMFGTNPSDTVGDLHGVSSIAAGFTAVKVIEAFYQHTFPLSGTVVTAGIFDVNTDFAVAQYTNLFVNGGFSFDNTIGANASPSSSPSTALGLEMKTDISINAYVQAALFDGAPESEGKGFGDFTPNKDDGVFSILEVGWHEGEAFTPGYYKVSVGGWYLKKEPVAGFRILEMSETKATKGMEPEIRSGTGGMYLQVETSIGETLGLFFRAGRADADFNKYGQFYAAGINYKGLIPGREEDLLGVGFAQTRVSGAWLNFPDPTEDMPDQTIGLDMEGRVRVFPAETAYEITYSSQVLPWLTVQPTFQYVLQPNMDPAIGNAAVFGIHLQATY